MSVNVDVALVPSEARTTAAVVIVIDQIRASTTITTLLDLGCEDLAIVPRPAEARRLGGRTGSLLAGEWHARKPPGFDFDNSPVELTRADLRGRGVVLCTTNGAAVLHRVRDARIVLVGCLRNARACAQAAVSLAGTDGEIQVVCAGLHGRFALEDAVAAGAIVGRIGDVLRAEGREMCLADAADAAVRLRLSYPDMRSAMDQSSGGATLRRIDQAVDIDFCAEEDASTTVARVLPGPPMRATRLEARPAAGDMADATPEPAIAPRA